MWLVRNCNELEGERLSPSGILPKLKQNSAARCKYNLTALIKDIMQSDLRSMQKDQYLKYGRYKKLNYFE